MCVLRWRPRVDPDIEVRLCATRDRQLGELVGDASWCVRRAALRAISSLAAMIATGLAKRWLPVRGALLPAARERCMHVCMERLTISLSDEAAARLKREARRRRVAVSALVRSAIDEALAPAGRGRRIAFAGVGSSGRRDTSKRVDEILRAEWPRARNR